MNQICKLFESYTDGYARIFLPQVKHGSAVNSVSRRKLPIDRQKKILRTVKGPAESQVGAFYDEKLVVVQVAVAALGSLGRYAIGETN